MTPVELGNGRFVLERLAGSGGMGEVFFARDREGAQPVAIKRLRVEQSDEQQRFVREARLLSNIDHPHVVRHVAHGVDADGSPWLAMEWLEGEDLSARLSRGPLEIRECIDLGRCAASGLAALHDRGIVHRDIKPSNLFISGGQIESVKLLDLGIARVGAQTGPKLTGTNAMLGTVGYMAPEQANGGSQGVGAWSDIFALGAVLYEAICGTAPFAADHAIAILTKILFEEPTPITEKRSDVPDALGQLVMRMLSKTPAQRPKDGAALVDAFTQMGDMFAEETRPSQKRRSSGSRRAVTRGERRVIALVVVAPPANEDDVDDGLLREIAERFGGRFERMWDGTSAVLFQKEAVPTDLCAQAARCAIAIRGRVGNRAMALAVERTDSTSRALDGGAIEKAVRLLLREPRDDEGSTIALDDVAAGLLDARFEVRTSEGVFLLFNEHTTGGSLRTLLGRPTPSVGRERDLRMLEETFAECVEERTAMVTLVVAGPGIGKTRLAHDFLNGIRGLAIPSTVWSGRGDSLRAGSAFALVQDLVKRAASLMDDQSIETRRARLLDWVTAFLPNARERAIGELLGEICGVPFPDDANAALREARRNPETIGERARAAFLEVLGATLDNAPTVILLEDLHWGDLPSVQLFDRALREFSEQPLFVLALARPSVAETFPKLWAQRRFTEIRLRELPRRASEQLVRQFLGHGANPDVIERIVQLSGGNAFYLEELIRAAAERKSETFPETVVAMVESRLAALDPFSRHVLRAASIYGDTFWAGAAAELVGGERQRSRVIDVLGELIAQEFVIKKRSSRFAGEEEYAFRHALLREGARAMLLADDEALGHRLAAEWLEAKGEQDPIVLGEHFELGGLAERAAESWQRVAARASWAADHATAIKYAKRGLALTKEPRERCGLLELLCQAHVFSSQWNEAAKIAEEMATLAKPGSAAWARAILVQLMSAQAGVVTPSGANPLQTLEMLLHADPEPAGLSSMAVSMLLLLFTVVCLGRLDLGEACACRLDELRRLRGGEDESARLARGAMQPFVYMARGLQDWAIGAYDDAERALRSALEFGEGLGPGLDFTYSYLGEALADQGRGADAKEVASQLIAHAKTVGRSLSEGRGRWVMSDALRAMGDLEAAEREARSAMELLKDVQLDLPAVLASLACVLRLQGRFSEALAAAEQAMQLQASMGQLAYRRVFVRVTYAECLHASGDVDGAVATINGTTEWLDQVANTITNADKRRTFLEGVVENRRAIEWARTWANRGQA